MQHPLAPKQLQFIIESTAKWNIAHGSVRSGKTVGTLMRFMQAANDCPDSQIFMVGHSSDTIYQNVVRLLLESEQFAIFRPFCTWFAGKRQLRFRDKMITCLGAKDEGAIGSFQGKTFSLVLCDEMTLYPESIIDMIDTRLSKPYSMGFASMNPSHPGHKIKQWIDKAEEGDKNYYSLHYTLDDNPYVDEDYKQRIRDSLSGLFYKRNYLGLWCLAEGAIFDFFDRKIHVVSRPPRAAEYWIAGIDYGTVNNFACILMGISTGRYTQTGVCRWFEKEYVWDSKKMGRQKTNAEYADDVLEFLEPYGVKAVYVDPSAAAFKLELRKRGLHVVDADNDVTNGITYMTSEMKKGNLFICKECEYLIKETESYVWDTKAAERGYDAPLKKDDHCFEENTLVMTLHGLKKIKEINQNHRVLTREGYKRVKKRHMKWGYLKEYQIHGHQITCTEDHQFYTLHKGWIEIKDLIQSDIVVISKSVKECLKMAKRKRLPGMEKDTDVIRNLLITMIDDIITEQDTIFIEMFGNSITEKYRTDTIYITETETPVIIAYPISNVSEPSIISTYIKKIFEQINLQTNVEKLQPSGTSQMTGGNGIKNMQNVAISERTLQEILNVKTAIDHTPHKNSPTQSFVRITVSRNGEEKLVLMMSSEIANCVINNIPLIDIADRFSAQSLVEGNPIGKTRSRVYDLSVEGCHEYFAQGILVHNCMDAARYAVFTHKVSVYNEYLEAQNQSNYLKNRFQRTF